MTQVKTIMKRPRILIVDDVSANLKVMESVLDDFDADLLLADSGDEALYLLMQNDDFALAILDVQMPGMNGYELAELIRSRERTKHLPIVFLSAVFKSDESVFQGYQSGAVDFLTKPFNPDVLRAKVTVFLDLYLIRRESVVLAEQRSSALHEMAVYKNFLHRIYENMSDGLLVLDKHCKVVEFNPKLLDITQLTDAEIRQRSLAEILGQDIAEALKQKVSYKNSEITLSRPDGTQAYISISYALLRDNEGLDDGVLIVLTDISELSVLKERDRFRSELERQDRLAALGTLAAGTAHDFNNMLAIVMGYVEVLKAKSSDGGITKTLDVINQTLERGVGVVSKLTAMGSNAPARLAVFCMADQLIEESQFLVDAVKGCKLDLSPIAECSVFTSGAECDEECKRKCASSYGVYGDRSAFSQVIANLCINASHALAGRENASITLSLEKIPEEKVLRLQVSDNGCGMPPEVKRSIFDPFYTTKAVGEGTGLGLFMVHGIVTRKGGKIECESVLGEGTVFTITLPLVE